MPNARSNLNPIEQALVVAGLRDDHWLHERPLDLIWEYGEGNRARSTNCESGWSRVRNSSGWAVFLLPLIQRIADLPFQSLFSGLLGKLFIFFRFGIIRQLFPRGLPTSESATTPGVRISFVTFDVSKSLVIMGSVASRSAPNRYRCIV